MPFNDFNTFNENLRLTQQYCAQQLLHTEKDVAEMLRSINPEYSGSKIFDFAIETFTGTNYNAAQWAHDPFETAGLVDLLFQTQLQCKKAIPYNNQNEQAFAGRLLACEFEETITDGGAEMGSKGVIDVFDMPPIDTWVYILEAENGKILFAWIPDKYVPLVESGIKAGILDILYWVQDTKSVLNKLAAKK